MKRIRKERPLRLTLEVSGAPAVSVLTIDAGVPLGPTEVQMAEGYVDQKCRHCGVTTHGHRRLYCMACGKGYA